ncbi:MAG TPA: carbohydrate ABC transporter permease [Candidatus Eisenbergiella merdipullorum]|uniref:Carbohydrate ABC transporter permease n=1 Tax=Candidatus Eisenbergiella merdipullorum TaxID=2838553 RepID=A0A9D2L147_9FIRM|nr:carbohydrate ABC transporter permease [Candidatus Eisenbergiella merdipullorum]
MKKHSIGQDVLWAILGICAVVCLLPLILVVIASFTDEGTLAINGFSYFPKKWSLEGWKYVGTFGKQLIVSYGVTIFVTVVGTIFSIVVTSMFAYTQSRKNFCLRGVLAIYMLITMLLSGGMLSGYLVNTTVYHLKDTLLILILPGVSGMQIIYMRSYIESNIPESLVESVKIDGGSEMRAFWQIVFPLMKPVVAALSFMSAVGYWNDWQKPYLYISSSYKMPLQLLLQRIETSMEKMNSPLIDQAAYASLAQTIPSETARMALLLTVLGPIMIAYPFFQKYFVQGLTIGAVKG